MYKFTGVPIQTYIRNQTTSFSDIYIFTCVSASIDFV